MVDQRPARAGRLPCGYGRAELFVFQRLPREERQICRGGIILPAVEPVGICKAGIQKAQRLRAAVHFPHELLHAPAVHDGQRRRGVIAGLEHHAIEQVPHAEALSVPEVHA